MKEPLHSEYQTDLKIHRYLSLTLKVMTLILLIIATVGLVLNPSLYLDYLLYLFVILLGAGVLIYDWSVDSGITLRETFSQLIKNKKVWYSTFKYATGVIGGVAILSIYYILAESEAQFDFQTFLLSYYSIFLLVYLIIGVLFVITGWMVWKELRLKSRDDEKELRAIQEVAQRISKKSNVHQYDSIINVLKTCYYNREMTWEKVMETTGEKIPESTYSTWKTKLNEEIMGNQKGSGTGK